MDKRPDGVLPAEPAHIEHLLDRLREEHVREIADTSRLSPAEALRQSYRNSAACYAAVRGGEPVFLMGVEEAGLITATAKVWMLGTEAISRRPIFALRAARWGIGEAYRVTGAARLEQWIPVWYETGLRFVERLGFIRHPGGGDVHVTHEKRNSEWAH